MEKKIFGISGVGMLFCRRIGADRPGRQHADRPGGK